MLIVDAQVHIWSQGTPSGQHRQISRYSAEDCLKEMGEGGVDAAVLHPPGWDPKDVEVAVEAARQYPNRFAILGHFPLDKPESRSLIDDWKSRPGMLGLRFFFLQPHQQNWPIDGTMDWLWPAAERAQIPIALMASNHLPAVGRIAERHPGLRLLIDHFARVRGEEEQRHADRRRAGPHLVGRAADQSVASPGHLVYGRGVHPRYGCGRGQCLPAASAGLGPEFG